MSDYEVKDDGISRFPAPPGKPKSTFPPNKRTSYALASTLIGTAAGSAMAIDDPLYRTLAIVVCAVAAYFIGLKTV